MGQGIIGNMQVFPGPSLPELVAGLQLVGAGAKYCQNPARKMYARRWSKVIKTGDKGSLEIWIGIRDGGF